MREVDPRHWFLVASASLLACKDPEANETDSDETNGESTDDDGMCEQDSECADGLVCSNGQCVPWVSDVEGYTNDCYTDSDCQEGYVCSYYSCVPGPPTWEQPLACEGPQVASTDLPEMEAVLELQFLDVDGDGREELLMLRPDYVITLLSDDTIVTNPIGIPLPEYPHDLVPLQLQAMTPTDIALFAGDVAVLGVGDGMGGFTFTDSITGFPPIADAIAIDPDQDGVDTIAAALGGDLNTGVLFDDFAGLQTTNQVLEGPYTVEVDRGELTGDGQTDLLFGYGCGSQIKIAPDFADGNILMPEGVSGTGWCEWAIGGFTGNGPDQPLELFEINSATASLLAMYPNDGVSDVIYTLLPQPHYSALRMDLGQFANPYLAMIQSGPGSVSIMWFLFDLPAACLATLPIAEGITTMAAGDRDGDGIDELATINVDGLLAIHSLTPPDVPDP